MLASQPRWYLVRCKVREESRALMHLERQGFECYRPVCERESVRHGKKKVSREALFPGYLFIRLDRTYDNWLPICSTRGVVQIVRFAEYPLPVSDEIIDEIRGRVEAQPREPYFRAGDRVVITNGSFSGIQAIFLASDGDERVVLLLNILQREHAVNFPMESVRKLP